MTPATDSSKPLLSIHGLTKRYPSGSGMVTAISGLNLTLQRGEFVAVMGASGSGKSTLLHLVAGLTLPGEGSVRIADTDINALSDYERTLFRRQHIGLVFQAFNLIPTLTGAENIALPVLLGGGGPVPERVQNLLQQLGLNAVGHRRPDTMSGGEQQRIAIGRALVNHPALILADEPTGSLDSANGRRLCEIFRTLCQEHGVAVLMATHNPVVAFAASRFVILRDGRIVRQFDKQECKTVQELDQAFIDLMEQPNSEQPK